MYVGGGGGGGGGPHTMRQIRPTRTEGKQTAEHVGNDIRDPEPFCGAVHGS